MMEQEPADVLFSQPATPQQSAWLDTTRVPLRSVGFTPAPMKALGRSVVPELAAVMLTVSRTMLESSTRTLEVMLHPAQGSVVAWYLCEATLLLAACAASCGLSCHTPHAPAMQAHGASSQFQLLTARAQEARNLFVARVPRHVTTLARFAPLRRLSLQGVEGLSADEVRVWLCRQQTSKLWGRGHKRYMAQQPGACHAGWLWGFKPSHSR